MSQYVGIGFFLGKSQKAPRKTGERRAIPTLASNSNAGNEKELAKAKGPLSVNRRLRYLRARIRQNSLKLAHCELTLQCRTRRLFMTCKL
jgi:hypothetical protein